MHAPEITNRVTAMHRLRGRVLGFAAIAELATGLVLLADPSLVVALLLGARADATVRIVARCFGIALIALGVACWPDKTARSGTLPALRAMLIYNVLIALFLAYLATAGQAGGPLIWPAVGLHGLVAVLLLTTWRSR